MASRTTADTLKITFINFSVLFVAALALLGCGSGPGEDAEQAAEAVQSAPPLRVLTLRQPDGPGFLPRNGLPEAAELELLAAYAESEGRPLEVVPVDAFADLFPFLLEGRGDLIAANLTITEQRRNKVAFTTPVTYVREVVIGRKGERLENAQGMGGRKIAVHAGSSFQETLESIRKKRYQPSFEIIPLSATSDDLLLDGVVEGAHDLTMLDSNSAGALLAGRDELQVALTLSGVRPVAWAVRPDDEALLASLNGYLSKHHLLQGPDELHKDDLDRIRERGVLRVATRNNTANYFLWQGELLGFEYELAKHFADSQGLRLAVVVPPSQEALLEWVREGRADLAAASLTISEARQGGGIVFSRPYHEISELVVTHADDVGLQSVADLDGRRIAVRRSSSYWSTLERLQEEGVTFTVQAAPEHLETEQIIQRVASGEYDLTVADSHILDIEMTWRDDIRPAFALGKPRSHGWAMRSSNPLLREAVNSYLKREYRGLFYNVIYRKYFKNPKRIREHVELRADAGENGALSPFDDLVLRYAQRYGLDWRLAVSQMYQESRFNPKAKSWAGALGLMQVLPRTARELGLGDLHDPENGVHAGMKYMGWLMQRFEPELNPADRIWFALAAYNAGVGHVRDARRLAAQKGLDPDRWFGNVERAMLLLSQSEYARRAAHGYVRGQEPVNYVRQIRDRFEAYVRLTEPRQG